MGGKGPDCVGFCGYIQHQIRKHAGVVSAQRHGPGRSGVQSHRQRLPPSHHRLHVSVCMYATKWSRIIVSIRMRPHVSFLAGQSDTKCCLAKNKKTKKKRHSHLAVSFFLTHGFVCLSSLLSLPCIHSYFRKGSYFGLACFANMAVDSTVERGARMKSVGILSPSYTLLYRYMSFLEHQVRLQLQSPGHYSPLEAFYEDKRAILPPGGDCIVTACPASAWGAAINHSMHPEMKITHPAGCMSQFIRFFGEQIMVLWKLALLRRRILIFSPPPVGVVCYRVYCCCCLANISIPGVSAAVPEFRPFFYVNVADISALENELSYVACTTEKIFEEKKDLYDVYVDNQNVKTYRDGLKPLLRLSAADREKYRKLTEQRQMLLYSQEENGDCVSSEEDLFILFFLEQNNRIFQTLSEVAGSPDPTLTQESVRAMGLDPHGDRLFLLHLLEIYGYDTLLVSEQLCCS
uniref:DENN domain-containing protein 11 n=1 Tax=Lates calcarifer TaxID=8187 RepID=A0A4W6DXX7_LATCA